VAAHLHPLVPVAARGDTVDRFGLGCGLVHRRTLRVSRRRRCAIAAGRGGFGS
jgi:hypothetical protein